MIENMKKHIDKRLVRFFYKISPYNQVGGVVRMGTLINGKELAEKMQAAFLSENSNTKRAGCDTGISCFACWRRQSESDLCEK